MRAIMPFDTEKERKPLKLMEFSFSWRQGSYLAVSLLIFIQSVQYSFNDNYPLPLMAAVLFLNLIVFIPGLVLAFVKHSGSGLFLDKYIIFYIKHSKKESIIWRRG